MSKVQASAESIRQLANDLKKSIATLNEIASRVQSAGNVSDWNDAQGAQFGDVVKKISVLTRSPIPTLENAVPRLEKLAAAIDKYSSVSF